MPPQRAHRPTLSPIEVLLLALALTAAWHGVCHWLVTRILPTGSLITVLGPGASAYVWDLVSLWLPLLLCLGAPVRSGLCIGEWHGRIGRVLVVCGVAVGLTALIYPFTSQPFTGARAGVWLISPLAQDLLFTGYLYGLLDAAFPGYALRRFRVRWAVLLTAFYFALWHTPNFFSIHPAYVAFQLLYTFLGGAWVLLARQWTRSIIPGLLTHMAVNFIAWKGW